MDDLPILEVQNLHVSFSTPAGILHAVRGASFQVRKGEIVGLVGESGCGKSVSAQSILKLLANANISGGILLEGEDLASKSHKELEAIRGNRVGMIFQDPMTALNPTMRIGHQIAEPLKRHRRVSTWKAREMALQLLQSVGISDAASRIDQYPFSLSGGMRQRVMIAIALACEPELIVADEPTTALDVTIQAQILELIKDLNRRKGTSLLLITHDLGVVAQVCDRVIVMYAGQIMETGSVDQIFYDPQHPYTKALLHSIPRLGVRCGARLEPIAGTPPDLLDPPSGCPFHPRCKYAMRICSRQSPLEWAQANKLRAACWLHHDGVKERLESYSSEVTCNP